MNLENSESKQRQIQAEVLVNAELHEVWQAWTTEKGAQSFFAPECKIDLVPGGAYEMYFDLNATEGLRGGEGCVLLAIQPMEMLSFTWNAPPQLPTVRGQNTHVTVWFATAQEGTRVTIVHDGWGMGGEWDQAFDYFVRAWKKTVLPRLKSRFDVGPVDWSQVRLHG